MNIWKHLIRTGAAAAAVLALTPAALAAGEGAVYIPRSIPAAVVTPAAPAEEDWQLMLVNPWNTLPEDYAVELATLANGLQVDARIYDALDEIGRAHV